MNEFININIWLLKSASISSNFGYCKSYLKTILLHFGLCMVACFHFKFFSISINVEINTFFAITTLSLDKD